MRPLLLLVLSACGFSAIEDSARLGPLTQVKQGFTSAFWAETEAGVVLFDTTADSDATRLVASLQAAGFSTGDVADVFATHGHGDHVGGLATFTAARVHALAAELERITETAGIDVTDPHTAGEVIDLGGITVEVFATPGHTSGNGAFLIADVLLLGDSAVAKGDGSITTLASFDDDPALARTSLEGLRDDIVPREDEVATMAFSHSGSLGGTAALEAYPSR